MAQMSVEQFANELGLLPAVLLEQLKAAGVKKMLAEDSLTEQDKALLLDYLRKTHGTTETKSKVTLTRRQTSEIRKSDSTGRARTIQVEVRKRRVLTKPMMTGDADAIPATVSKSAEVTKQAAIGSIIDEDQLALRNEEARKQAELIARQTEEIRQKRARKSTEATDHAQKKATKAEIITETNPTTIDSQPSETTQPITDAHPITVKNNETEQPGNIDSQSSPTGGTLHKPPVKAEEKTDKKKKQTKQQVIWKDENTKNGVLKPMAILPADKAGEPAEISIVSLFMRKNRIFMDSPLQQNRLCATLWCRKPFR